VEECFRVGHLVGVHGLYELQELVEAVVCALVSFFAELFVSDENLIVGVYVRDGVGKSILSLGCEVPHDVREDSRACSVALISFPVVALNQLDHHFGNLEEVVFGVRRYDDQESEHFNHHVGGIL